MTTTTLDRQSSPLARQINSLARMFDLLPVSDGTQQKWLVAIMVALLNRGVAFNALYCALEDAQTEVEA